MKSTGRAMLFDACLAVLAGIGAATVIVFIIVAWWMSVI